MSDTEVQRLEARLQGCHECAIVFRENVATIEDENGHLTAEQVIVVLRYLNELHNAH
jgi:hypothetical protein